ncbi:MAG: TonB-dependent receptor [Prevotellaceae bacterium]|jgi:outer membrane receptor protein involved in Fe transport|nr:TonB-dependent receptor [Prevotellaceae bacterium]
MNNFRSIFVIAVLLCPVFCPLYAGGASNNKKKVEGFVHSAKTQEPVVGAAVLVKGTSRSAMTGVDGRFLIENLDKDACTLQIRCMSYKTVEAEYRLKDDVTRLSIGMEDEALKLDEVVVKGTARRSAEIGMVQSIKSMPQVASGMSGAQIAKGPDRVAAEVIRRIPGVSIINERLIIVRGLSQRYNNAWINGLSAPSTETDSRSFPFDLVPSSQIDNLVVYKSPSPEIPADFSGGFVKITSKSIPDENLVEVSYNTGFNVNTAGRSFRMNPGGSADFLGFDSKRTLPKDFPKYFPKPESDPDGVTRFSREGFNGDWRIKTITPLPDQRLSLTVAQRMEAPGGREAGVITAVSYSNTFSSIGGMTNARYGIYNAAADKPIYLDNYRDNRYSNDARVGVLHSWSLALNPSHRLEFKNLLNILGRNRLTERSGVKDMSSPYYREQTEMQYTSRLTYNGQLSGMHDLTPSQTLAWDAGYSYARKDEPDRRIVTNQVGTGSFDDAPPAAVGNDNVSRYFQDLSDNNVSVALNYKYAFSGEQRPVIKAGAYGEYHARSYAPREFTYRYENLDYAFRSNAYLYLPVEEMLSSEYLSADKVYVEERAIETSAYSARVQHAAGYAAVDAPLGRLTIYAGVRAERRLTELSCDRADAPTITLLSTKTTTDFDLLPSVNLTFRLTEMQQLRAAYGRSLNRPEVREMSPAVYFDFDLFSEIGGNENLKTASIHNFDLRYELYPGRGETVSFGVFYKHFTNPIEWTFIDMGGSLRYSYENAKAAESFGVELDVQKTLDFVGIPDLSLALNAAFIESRVHFVPGEVVTEPDRPMQGQSPYVINAGLYYKLQKRGLNASLLYNRIGERIVGLGKFNSADNNDVNSHIPNTYEMPRNSLDFSVSKAIGKNLELRCSLTDILSENVVYKQFPVFRSEDGAEHKREQTTRSYNPGQHFSIGVRWKIRYS